MSIVPRMPFGAHINSSRSIYIDRFSIRSVAPNALLKIPICVGAPAFSSSGPTGKNRTL